MQEFFTIGVAGHVDHGKTALVRCLTGIETDRKPEEKLRGLSIESGIAPLTLPAGRQVALIDVPGHTDYLKNAIRGLNRVDLGMLVVAVDDGVMPQTREHLEILNYFGARGGLVVLNKVDLVDEETVELAELEIREVLEETYLANKPILRFSMHQPELGPEIAGELEREIERLLSTHHRENRAASFRLWVDQIRNFTGFGTVVSGTVQSGHISVGDTLLLQPAGIKTRARSLQSHGREVTTARPGQRIGVNLANVPTHRVARGMALTANDTAPGFLFNAHLRVSPHARHPIKNRQRVKLHLGTAMVTAMVVLMGPEHLAPGSEGFIQMRLPNPLCACCRDRFVICLLNENRVIGGGVVLEAANRKYRPSKHARVVPYLESLHRGDIAQFVDFVFDHNATRLISADRLAAETGLAAPDLQARINARVAKKELVYYKGLGAISTRNLDELTSKAFQIANAIFEKNPLRKNLSLSEIIARLESGTEETVVKIIADKLCDSGQWIRLDGGYRATGAGPTSGSKHGELIENLMAYAQTSGLTPFSADTFYKVHGGRWQKQHIRKTLDHLFSLKQIIRLDDNRYLSLQALEEIKIRVRKAIEEKGHIIIQDCRSILGYGRWVGTPILDYLDSINFTYREGKERYLVSPDNCRSAHNYEGQTSDETV